MFVRWCGDPLAAVFSDFPARPHSNDLLLATIRGAALHRAAIKIRTLLNYERLVLNITNAGALVISG